MFTFYYEFISERGFIRVLVASYIVFINNFSIEDFFVELFQNASKRFPTCLWYCSPGCTQNKQVRFYDDVRCLKKNVFVSWMVLPLILWAIGSGKCSLVKSLVFPAQQSHYIIAILNSSYPAHVLNSWSLCFVARIISPHSPLLSIAHKAS